MSCWTEDFETNKHPFLFVFHLKKENSFEYWRQSKQTLIISVQVRMRFGEIQFATLAYPWTWTSRKRMRKTEIRFFLEVQSRKFNLHNKPPNTKINNKKKCC